MTYAEMKARTEKIETIQARIKGTEEAADQIHIAIENERSIPSHGTKALADVLGDLIPEAFDQRIAELQREIEDIEEEGIDMMDVDPLDLAQGMEIVD